jgi:hypothetical protein
LKNANKSPKYIFFFFKNSRGVSKNAEFHADFKSFEKGLKKCTKKKLLAQTWQKYVLFPLLLMFIKLVLLIAFFGAFLKNFFNRFEISMKFCIFGTFFEEKKKFVLRSY